MQFETKDSGKRLEFSTGMLRDVGEEKPRFDLITPEGQKYEDTFLYRWAMLMERGRKKYSERNWEKAGTLEEMSRFKASALRHIMQYFAGETDEDHLVATAFNLNGYEFVRQKLEKEKLSKYILKPIDDTKVYTLPVEKTDIPTGKYTIGDTTDNIDAFIKHITK